MEAQLVALHKEAVVDVEDKMKNLKCPLCDEKVYSGIGSGCQMCGMPLKESQKNFCSLKCKIKYGKIHLKGGLNKNGKNKNIT